MIPIDYTTAITNGESIEFKLAEATKFTRAANRLGTIKTQFVKEMNLDREQTGDESDGSYEVVKEYLDYCLHQITDLEDRAWKEVYSNAEPYRENIEALSRGVILQAVNDYEQAISSVDYVGKATMREIERFAEIDASSFTRIDMAAVLERIRNTYPAFKSHAQANGKAITEDTKLIRRKKGAFPQAKHRCPLCGGGLYMSGNIQHGKAKICCSNCYLYTWVVVK